VSDEIIKEDLKKRSSKLDYSELKKRYDIALKTVEELEQQKADILHIKETHFDVFDIIPTKGVNSEATAFMVLSDVHAEEIVRPETVNGLNHYNIKIAEKRVKNFFINGIKLLKLCRSGVEIKHLVLAILGDLISNANLHEELLANTNLRPIEALVVVQNWIISGIKYILQNFDGKIIIPMTTSNHTRITKRIHVSNEVGNDMAYIVYTNIAQYFQNEKRVKCILPKSYHTYLKVYDMTVRISHGHFLKYFGGTGTLYVPGMKAIAQWNKMRYADLDIIGHYHNFSDFGNLLVNGSVIGFNPFAVSIKASFEEPKQLFFLLDKKRGKTIVAPILLNF
jgi:hypothetical protein